MKSANFVQLCDQYQNYSIEKNQKIKKNESKSQGTYSSVEGYVVLEFRF